MNLLKKYAIQLLIIAVSFIVGMYVLLPKIPEYFSKSSQVKQKNEIVNDLRKSIEIAKKAEIEASQIDEQDEKLIYQAESGMDGDTMVNFSGMLTTILELSKQSGLKTKTVEFKDIPESDLIKQNHSDTYSATLLRAQMVGTYTELQNFLREIYRHQYLMGINEIKITPYANDKKILIIDLSLALYAKK